MLIQVNWTSGHFDYVKDFMLDHLIESGVVAKFLRSSGWVTVGVDPIRSSKEQVTYAGAERRWEDFLSSITTGAATSSEIELHN